MNTRLQNSEGLPAKQLQENDNFSKEINDADVAELVDARDLKSLAHEPNQRLTSNLFCNSPAKTAGNPEICKTNQGSSVRINKASARGKRYAYIRGTNIALVRGFVGSDQEFDTAIAGAIRNHVITVNALRWGWRMDAANAIHRVTQSRARRRKFAYTFTAEAIAETLGQLDDRCELTGLPFDYHDKADRQWMRRPMAPSLDRKDNRRGYTPDNIRIVCTCVNIAINEWGLENFETVCRAFVARNSWRF